VHTAPAIELRRPNGRMSQIPRASSLIALAIAALVVAPPPATASSAKQSRRWIGIWSASPQDVYPRGTPIDPKQATTGGTLSPLFPPTLSGITPTYPLGPVFPGEQARDQSLRQIVHASTAGSTLRVRLTNRFGTNPVRFGDARVGLRARGAAVVRGTNRRLTFGGHRSVTIRPGGEAVSDRVRLRVRAHKDLAISLYVSGASGPMTWHALADTTSYATDPGAGDRATDERGEPFRNKMAHWLFIDGVDARAPLGAGTVVAFGDSITDGAYATFDADDRWPDVLAARLARRANGPDRSVVNEAIAGNKLTVDGQGSGGPAGLHRMGADVLSRAGVSHVILYLGINDVITGVPTGQIIDGMKTVILRARAHRLKILGATLTPGFSHDETRQAVNAWIRTSGAFDGVIDFDAVVRDPRDRTHWSAAYDSGDNLHPNAAGHRAMGNSIRLSLLTTPRANPRRRTS
jgi:lysophospholipase L1-like esterase